MVDEIPNDMPTNFPWVEYIFYIGLGILSVTTVLVIGDYYIPEYVRAIPYANNVLDGFYSMVNNLYNFFTWSGDSSGDASLPKNQVDAPGDKPFTRILLPRDKFSPASPSTSDTGSVTPTGNGTPTPTGSGMNTPIATGSNIKIEDLTDRLQEQAENMPSDLLANPFV